MSLCPAGGRRNPIRHKDLRQFTRANVVPHNFYSSGLTSADKYRTMSACGLVGLVGFLMKDGFTMSDGQGSILSGSDNLKAQGSFVKESQGVADGFRNVSQHWLPKTLTFEQGFEALAKQKQGREDLMVDVRDVNFLANGNVLTVGLNGKEYKPTDWAARQLCNWFDVPQTMLVHYRDNGPAQDLMCRAFRLGRDGYAADKKKESKKLLFRTYNDGTLRGVMSDSYSIVDNEWYMNVLQEFIPGGRLSHFHFGDADNFCGNVLVPDSIRSETDSDYGGMLNCGNSEIGKRKVFQRPSIFSAICMNGCIWGQQKGEILSKRHRGLILENLKEMIRLNIETQIPLLTTKVADFLNMRTWEATAPIVNIFAQISKAHNLSKEVTNKVGETWFGDAVGRAKTAFGVQDALTRAGQLFDGDTWETCDEIAGGLLMGGYKGWETLNAKASLMTEKEAKAVFGNGVA